jgi:hypothetical protein
MKNLTLKSLDLELIEPGYYLGALSITNIYFHVEAIVLDGNNDALNDGVQNRLDALSTMDSGDGHHTIEIDGQRAIVIIFPYQK